ncbi:MAG: nucleotidyltransferase family protein [Acetatifactor sp.]|nr:nucleotidyltransferase family protein [Acetatifactor sp.]
MKTESDRTGISAEEKYLLSLLRESLTFENDSETSKVTRLDWDKLCSIAQRHSVLPLLYDTLTEKEDLPEKVHKTTERLAKGAVSQSYRLLFLSKYLVGKMEAAGLSVVLLKGVATASFYPIPELRKSGDVDLLLLDKTCLKQVCGILQDCGCVRSEEQHALHHIVYCTKEGIEIEIHTMLAEPFDSQEINRYMQEKLPDCRRNIRRVTCMGVELPMLDTGYHAYELLLHMLQHFLWAGFGLRLLCDWVVFWNRETEAEEREKYLRLVRESRVKGFSDIVTLFCCTYLGLSQERVAWMEITGKYDLDIFLREIMEAEEFGNSAADRMVTLRNNSLGAYVREFQHQMHLNFPRAGRYFPLWPGLWLVTLIRFLRNNRKIRRVSARAVLKKAGQRSRVMEQIQLWKY